MSPDAPSTSAPGPAPAAAAEVTVLALPPGGGPQLAAGYSDGTVCARMFLVTPALPLWCCNNPHH